ncbi:hypothetical protein VN97_g5358 [Penicillium thymicola]|uniref:Uncharacterized protein n=1 Tax=Penicillium thymicola TaxID=293382 RepID=A0AAI9TIZ6_PENTH|nr:hypothetical protein VN97_g5358 [Penicillium thymicola]
MLKISLDPGQEKDSLIPITKYEIQCKYDIFPIAEAYLYELSQGKADQRTRCLGFDRFLLIGPGIPRFRLHMFLPFQLYWRFVWSVIISPYSHNSHTAMPEIDPGLSDRG